MPLSSVQPQLTTPLPARPLSAAALTTSSPGCRQVRRGRARRQGIRRRRVQRLPANPHGGPVRPAGGQLAGVRQHGGATLDARRGRVKRLHLRGTCDRVRFWRLGETRRERERGEGVREEGEGGTTVD